MSQPQFTLRMILENPFGKSYSVAMPIDAFDALDRYVGLTPPSEFDGRTLESTVEVIRKREYRKDDFRAHAIRLAIVLGERMEDEEGWHGIDRQQRYEERRRNGQF